MELDGFSPKQLRAMTWWMPRSPDRDCEAIVCDGAVRSGKTLSMGLGFFLWAMCRFDGRQFGLCGKTMGSLRRNVLQELTPWLEMLGMQVTERYSEHLLRVRFAGRENRFYVFGGRDESAAGLIQGITFAGILMDEVVLMPRSFVEQALTRCSVDGAKLWFSCNPGSPQHWFYTEWIQRNKERNALYLHFEMTDNPGLSQKTLERYQSMFSGVFYDRYIRGLWVVAEGLIYPMFDESCIVDELPETGEYYVSCDYGTLNPFSAGLWRWDGKTATRIREYYYSGRESQKNKTDEEYADEIKKLIGDADVKSIIVDPSAASFIEVLRRRGYIVRKANNDVTNGIMTTARFLQDGILKVHRGCKDCIREFGLYRWDEKSADDRPIKENDHAMDETRYFAYTILKNKAYRRDYTPIWNR